MATQTKNGVEWTYTYDANGMRTSRSSDSKTYDYVYSGDKLVQMTITDTTANTTQLLEFAYDAAGQPLTMTLDGTVYYYLLNIQGDVMGLVDGSGNLQAAFSYTAYGKAYSINNVSSMGTTLASANPLTYRGYVLDMGTGIYYLQSRYYDPQLGRFLNADAYASTGQGFLGNNMFAYCGNNPTVRVDIFGNHWFYTINEDETRTEEIGENEQGAVYQTTIVFEAKYYSNEGVSYESLSFTDSVSFEYTVTTKGVILYDNNQEKSNL